VSLGSDVGDEFRRGASSCSRVATYVLIHGAGDDSFHWHRLVPELTRRGHEVVAPDLPCDDDRAGFAQYAQTVLAALGGSPDRNDLVVVAQSLAGFTAPLVCDRIPGRPPGPPQRDDSAAGRDRQRLVGRHR
jgi:pimeloyl-ACP methyl ester carboxylesterase